MARIYYWPLGYQIFATELHRIHIHKEPQQIESEDDLLFLNFSLGAT